MMCGAELRWFRCPPGRPALDRMGAARGRPHVGTPYRTLASRRILHARVPTKQIEIEHVHLLSFCCLTCALSFCVPNSCYVPPCLSFNPVKCMFMLSSILPPAIPQPRRASLTAARCLCGCGCCPAPRRWACWVWRWPWRSSRCRSAQGATCRCAPCRPRVGTRGGRRTRGAGSRWMGAVPVHRVEWVCRSGMQLACDESTLWLGSRLSGFVQLVSDLLRLCLVIPCSSVFRTFSDRLCWCSARITPSAGPAGVGPSA